MPSLTLYCFPGACSRATMIALEEAGLFYQTRVINLRQGAQKSSDYVALNPKGKVPCLVVDGTPLTENIAILGYLADTNPSANLLPPITDAFTRAQALSAVGWLSSSILPLFSRIMRPQSYCDSPGAAGRLPAMAKEEALHQLALAETHMRDREWWIHTWSVADAYLFYIETAMERFGIPAASFPALAVHTERMKARPAVQRVLAWEEQAQKQAA